MDTVQQVVKHGDKVDVLFLGDSITEGWSGKFMGVPAPHRLGKSSKVFVSLFSKDDGGRYQGLALGISGDKASDNLSLWCFIIDQMLELTFHVTLTGAHFFFCAGCAGLFRCTNAEFQFVVANPKRRVA